MKILNTAVASMALTLCASSAMAAVISVTSVYGEWTNTTPSDVYGLSIVTDADSSVMSWGDPVFTNQSAYTFETLIPPSSEVDAVSGAEFDLGLFTHDNFRIWANPPSGSPTITSADLNLAIDFSVDGTLYSLNQVFSFDHDETPNSASTCAYGDAPGTGINGSYGCADRVSAALNEGLSETVVIDGLEYSFDISGFLYEDELLSYFLTREEEENQAILVGKIIIEPVSEVPLPASGVLLLGGLAGMAMVRRRRRA